ncbi:hypothetical protein [uncultured Deinococcus sp.]|uniref:hypothetical protein n=1 Tax=uncultured Deinococcus sp. TaxID=158789 RepID=UPI0025EE3A9D|nr:hypothetical protein [uncultured Deinococcus sp.]
MIRAASPHRPAPRWPLWVALGLLDVVLLALLVWLGGSLLAVILGVAVMLNLAALGERQGWTMTARWALAIPAGVAVFALLAGR